MDAKRKGVNGAKKNEVDNEVVVTFSASPGECDQDDQGEKQDTQDS